VLGIALKIGLKPSMAFHQHDWREIKFTGFKGPITASMGAMGSDRLNTSQRKDAQSQKNKRVAELKAAHWIQHNRTERNDQDRRLGSADGCPTLCKCLC